MDGGVFMRRCNKMGGSAPPLLQQVAAATKNSTSMGKCESCGARGLSRSCVSGSRGALYGFGSLPATFTRARLSTASLL
jgi:hypothetical protein